MSNDYPSRSDNCFCDPVLLRESEVSRLYRVSSSGKHFIIKTPRDPSGRLMSLVKREYDIAAKLDHPYIIKVYTYEERSVVGPGIVMEYVDGRTLDEFIAENPSAEQRRRVMGQILDAVGYIHRKGVIHNDLKPGNILVTRVDNDVRIIDFGLSDDDAYYLTKTLGCTPQYASPELLRREPLDSRSDIYSLGLLMKLAFGRKYSHITRRCLRQDKERRFGNVDQIAKALRRPIYLYILIALLSALLALVFIDLNQRVSVAEKFTDHMAEDKALVDSLKIETRMKLDSIFTLAAKMIEDIPYRDLAYAELGRCTENINEIWQAFPQTESGEDLMLDYQMVLNEMMEKILSIIEEKPPLSREVMSEQEFLYYYDILVQNRPYEPFKH